MGGGLQGVKKIKAIPYAGFVFFLLETLLTRTATARFYDCWLECFSSRRCREDMQPGGQYTPGFGFWGIVGIEVVRWVPC